MSPKNKKKLEIIRSKLDKLDNKLLSLIKFRTNLVKEVLKLKEFKKEIVDKKRINFILKKIKAKSSFQVWKICHRFGIFNGSFSRTSFGKDIEASQCSTFH